jgi:hypothetical protein
MTNWFVVNMNIFHIQMVHQCSQKKFIIFAFNNQYIIHPLTPFFDQAHTLNTLMSGVLFTATN